MSTDLWIWIAALLTLCIFSFLYKDNPFYKFAEHLLVGVSVGYAITFYFWNALIPKVWKPLVIRGEYQVIFPLILGLLCFSIFWPKISWFIRYPLAFTMGTYCGMAVPRHFQARIFQQLQGTMISSLSLSNIIMVVGVIATLTYFFFSLEHKGVLGKVAKLGIWYIMLAFGAAFGYTVMARISLFIGRLQFLLHDWLGLIH